MSEPTAARQSALIERHVELGAKLVDFAGWSMPMWYDGATPEHHAVRTASGLFDLSHMGQIVVSGVDAGRCLDWSLLLTASTMPLERARYTMMCTPDGGIVDDLIVYRIGDDDWLVIANASNAATVVTELVNRASDIGAAPVIEDRTEQRAMIALQGPDAAALLAGFVDRDLSGLGYYRILSAEFLGQPALVARTGYTGEDGFEIITARDRAVAVWDALAGGSQQVSAPKPCGLAARDTLRMEAAMPLYGNELSTDVNPFDVGAGRLVRSGGGFVGAEALERRSLEPHRHLVGLAVDGRRPARAGYLVSDGEQSLGQVTSGALSPTLGMPIALALLDVPAAVGDELAIDVRSNSVPATVVELPFYTRA